eukprot:gene20117-26845_t
MSSELQAVQFTFSDASTTSLQLGRSQRLSMSSGDRMGSLALGKTRFSVASASSAKGKSLVMMRPAGMPNLFASISIALPLASASAASKPTKGAAKVANEAPTKKKTLKEIVDYAGKRALSGGIPGMVAMGMQVLTLMWLRTTINYQYRYGGTITQALSTLYSQGGIPRFYQGLAPALIQ